MDARVKPGHDDAEFVKLRIRHLIPTSLSTHFDARMISNARPGIKRRLLQSIARELRAMLVESARGRWGSRGSRGSKGSKGTVSQLPSELPGICGTSRGEEPAGNANWGCKMKVLRGNVK